tara:strand:- start:391 stop:705 length:315 start_codon:yes stop_codon:yes gene_type:complete
MSNYEIFRAWMQIGGSGSDYIERKIHQAKLLKAPSTCIQIIEDEEHRPINFLTLQDCPKITVWRHAKLEKRLAEMQGRKPKTHPELISYLISIKNHWALRESSK